MENTTKEIIIATCNDDALPEFRGFKSIKIEREHHGHYGHSYEVKANTILQTNYSDMDIYGGVTIAVPTKIIILGYCDDLSFLDS